MRVGMVIFAVAALLMAGCTTGGIAPTVHGTLGEAATAEAVRLGRKLEPVKKFTPYVRINYDVAWEEVAREVTGEADPLGRITRLVGVTEGPPGARRVDFVLANYRTALNSHDLRSIRDQYASRGFRPANLHELFGLVKARRAEISTTLEAGQQGADPDEPPAAFLIPLIEIYQPNAKHGKRLELMVSDGWAYVWFASADDPVSFLNSWLVFVKLESVQ